MSRYFLAVGLIFASAVAVAQEGAAKTWEGTWTNKLYKSSGPLKCVARVDKSGNWTANFSGTFMGDPFRYDVTFQSREGKGQSDLSGTAKIRNANYEWTGTIKGDTLTGKYRGNNGYNGDFVLKAKK